MQVRSGIGVIEKYWEATPKQQRVCRSEKLSVGPVTMLPIKTGNR